MATHLDFLGGKWALHSEAQVFSLAAKWHIPESSNALGLFPTCGTRIQGTAAALGFRALTAQEDFLHSFVRNCIFLLDRLFYLHLFLNCGKNIINFIILTILSVQFSSSKYIYIVYFSKAT